MKNVIYQLVLSAVRNGGASLNTEGETPKSGYMVSLPGYELRIKANQLGTLWAERVLLAWAENVLSLAHIQINKGMYLGAWVNEDFCYFDISENIQDLQKATSVGQQRKQIAIWDVTNGEEITL